MNDATTEPDIFYAGYIKDTAHPERAVLLFTVRFQRPEDAEAGMRAIAQAFPQLAWTAGPFQRRPDIDIPSAV